MQNVTEKVNLKNLGTPDEVRTFEKGKAELYYVGGRTIGRATFEPGWKWSTCLKPIAKTETCQSSHLGYQLSGKMHIKTDDGREFDCSSGDLIYIERGHDAWVVGDEAVVVLDFQGMKDYAKPSASKPGSPQEESRPGRKH